MVASKRRNFIWSLTLLLLWNHSEGFSFPPIVHQQNLLLNNRDAAVISNQFVFPERRKCFSIPALSSSLAPNGEFTSELLEGILESEIPAAVDIPTTNKIVKRYTSCGTCRAVYIISPEMLGDGRRVKCAVCDHVWFQSSEKLQVLREGDTTAPFSVEKYKASLSSTAPRGVLHHTRTGAVTVFVGNLPYSINSDKLRTLFGTYGEITGVSIIIDGETNRPKGYAFIDFATVESGHLALDKLDGFLADGRPLTVKISEDRFSRGGPGRGGAGGFASRGGSFGGDRPRGPPPSGRDASGKFIIKRNPAAAAAASTATAAAAAAASTPPQPSVDSEASE